MIPGPWGSLNPAACRLGPHLPPPEQYGQLHLLHCYLLINPPPNMMTCMPAPPRT